MRKRLLVCDLDNTLYDWVYYFVMAFYAMVDEVVSITGCDREKLLDDFRVIHQKHADSEHPFALLETETIRALYPNASVKELLEIFDPAFHAFNARRKRDLVLYPGVRGALDVLYESGVRLVAHTESKLYAVVDRMIRLDLVKYFSRVYCRERTVLLNFDPEHEGRWLNRFPMERVVELSHHQRKPSPDVLLEICETENISVRDSAYVGDSIARDMLMAKKAGVYSIWAKYGTNHQAELYQRLVRITHWTADDVSREMHLKKEASSISPDFIAVKGFDEVLSALDLKVTLGR